ncbi:thermonuclease family protein [bacterium]|nr:thermonuclease family protein [bacterium]
MYKANKTKQVYIDFKGVDYYGRALGVIYFDKLNVNEDLQKNGGCMIYDYK